MPDTADVTATLLAAAADQGPGNTLRIVLLVSIVGGALLAWFLLRGYRNDADGADDTSRDPNGDASAGPGGNTDKNANA
ncbi:hypothetical protein [Streptomyces sp. NPDC056144]|uniref:hypothetical protein n=1 Tax=unclassified Streptomyces TaxID=2593676 RepID=UPI0035E05229